MKAPTTRAVVNYMVMPGIWPRVSELLFGGFGLVAYQIALIFQMVRILPRSHPYFVPGNISRYGILDVFREASAHLNFSRAHIDQIIIYFCLLGCLVLLGFFFLSLIVMVLSTPAFAGVNYSIINNVFVTPNPSEDVAYRLLDRVFGVAGIFNSKDLSPTAFHTAFHALLRYYSTLMIFIAAIVIFYYTAVVVGETTMYGTPFGKRFDTVWAPLRLVVAIGLLIPLSNGLNSGQYIALYAAKFGSSFGTNIWLKYNDGIKASLGASDATPLGYKPEDLLITPQPYGIGTLMEFLHTAGTCNILYRNEIGQGAGVWLVDENNFVQITTTGFNKTLSDFIRNVNGSGQPNLPRKTDPRFIFGDRDVSKYGGKYPHAIRPLCGELAVPFNASSNIIVVKLQASILGMITGLATTTTFGKYADNIISNNYPYTNRSAKPELGGAYATTLISELESFLNGAIPAFVSAYGARNPLDMVKEVRDLGWAGAGVWYNRLAEINGPIVSAQFNIAYPISYPMVMEEVAQQVARANPSIEAIDRFNPQKGGDSAIVINKEGISDPGLGIAQTLNASYKYWYRSGAVDDQQTKANIFLDYLSALFGTKAIFEMRENAHLHPMVSLIGLGKGLIEKGIRHMMIATGAAAAGGLIGILADKRYGNLVTSFSGIFVTLAMIGLVAGMILFYIIPFLPFLFVFFAAGAWVKSIFEAMVGVPLWALAHLRIEGAGLPLQGARQGYLLIFDIFLRPTLIMFGLIASMIIFGAMVFVLNDIFDLVTSNLTGFQDTTSSGPGSMDWTSVEAVRGPIDQFAFTLIYVVLVYLIAMSSFKLIDMIPKQIYKWFGGGVQSFASSIRDDFDEKKLIQYSTVGAFGVTQKIGGGLTSAGRMAGGAVGGLADAVTGGALGRSAQSGNMLLGAGGALATLGTIWAATDRGGVISAYGAEEATGPRSIDVALQKTGLGNVLNRASDGAETMLYTIRATQIEQTIRAGGYSKPEIEAQISGLLEEARRSLSTEQYADVQTRLEALRQELNSQ